MFKKVGCIIFSLTALMILWGIYHKPVFGGYAREFEAYKGFYSSQAQIVKTDFFGYGFIFDGTGEAVTLEKGTSAQRIISDFGATEVLTESVDGGTCYYCYSPNLKNEKIVDGKRVNLQIFDGDKYVKVGTPLIFGGY